MGAEHAVAVANGTAALHLSVLACGCGPSDEVILPSLNFVAGASVVRHAGATHLFWHVVGERDLNLDPRGVDAAAGPRARAIVALLLEQEPASRRRCDGRHRRRRSSRTAIAPPSSPFLEERRRFAEAVGVDLFDAVAAIRAGPTHSNMRRPGSGVGLLLPHEGSAARGVEAPAPSTARPAVPVLDARGRRQPDRADGERSQGRGALPRGLRGATILLMSVSYREDVADTRQSPSETFVRAARARGATVLCPRPARAVLERTRDDRALRCPVAGRVDAVVFAVPDKAYRELDLEHWLGEARSRAAPPAALQSRRNTAEAVVGE